LEVSFERWRGFGKKKKGWILSFCSLVDVGE
jgi:hypothetical protein